MLGESLVLRLHDMIRCKLHDTLAIGAPSAREYVPHPEVFYDRRPVLRVGVVAI
jgi:hypothetical protein